MDAHQPFWLARLAAAIGKTRERGIGWLRNRLREEFRTPTNGPGLILRRVLVTIEDSLTAVTRWGLRGAGGQEAGKTLYFFYDLEVCPITYDIASFMALAELERRRRELNSVHVVIVPGRRLEREPDDYQAAVGPAARQERIPDFVVPVTSLLPRCTGHTLCESRKQAAVLYRYMAKHVFPTDYRPRFPTAPTGREVRVRTRQGENLFPMFTASPGARRTMLAFLAPRVRGRRIIVITLREYAYMPARNSNLENWIAFANDLDPRLYTVVFVRDTSRAMDPVPAGMTEHIVCESASLHVGLRMALYEMAYLNMAVMQGPMELCWYNESCRYLLFLCLGTAPQTEPANLIHNKFEIGQQLPFARNYQRWIWESDDLSVVRREFDTMVPLLEALPVVPVSAA